MKKHVLFKQILKPQTKNYLSPFGSFSYENKYAAFALFSALFGRFLPRVSKKKMQVSSLDFFQLQHVNQTNHSLAVSASPMVGFQNFKESTAVS
jgi:hypothetical protein